MRRATGSILAALLCASAVPAMAQVAPAPIPAAADVPYPGGAMTLDIDATDTRRGIYRVVQAIPLAPGTSTLTLLFPQWLPGNHGPRGPLAELADLRFAVDGVAAKWVRDPVEPNAFRVSLPAGARSLEARFMHTSPLQSSEGRITMTQEMLNLQWEKMSLYPAGYYVRQIRVRPSVTLPAGWNVAAALDGKSHTGSRVQWAETDYETLVDSPIFAGAYFRRLEVGNMANLAIVADERAHLAAAPEAVPAFVALFQEAQAAFGRPPFDRYEMLLALTDRMGAIGLEHLRSSENQFEPKALTDWKGFDWDRNVVAHELVHAWNGKYRRPARLWTPDYRQTMQPDLLWVYEGQTQFWGWVLAARSGIQQKETVLGMMASVAGGYTDLAGREWRSVADTTLDPVFAARKPKPWGSLARGQDYYNEGALVWLEADQVIRGGTEGRKGLDDFARAFFSARPGERVRTYEFDDVVAALNAVHPHDWAGFLNARIYQPAPPAPLAGIVAGGYRLVWKAEPNPYDKAQADNARSLSLAHSLGMSVDRDGTIGDVRWQGPAANAGIVGGAKLIAVGGRAYDAEVLKQAIIDARGGTAPIELLIKRGDRFQTVPVQWHGGLRWPWLEKTGTAPAPLDGLLSPKRGAARAR